MRVVLVLAFALLLAMPAHASAPAPSSTSAPASFALAAAARAQGIAVLPTPTLQPGALRDEILAHYALHGAIPTAAGIADLDARLRVVPPEIQTAAASILAAQNAAAQLRAEAFARVTPADEKFVWGRLESHLSAEDAARAASIVAKVDASKMNEAARLVLDTIAAQKPILAAHADAMGPADFVDPLGQIEIAGTGNDNHSQDRALLIDLGGNDDWSNNAGATKPDFLIDAIPGCITTGGLDCTLLDGRRNGDVTQDLTGKRCSAYVDRAMFGGDASPDLGCAPTTSDPAGWTTEFVSKGTLSQGDEHDVAVGIDISGDDRYAPPKAFNDINNGHNAAGCNTIPNGEQGKTWARNLTAGGAFAGIGILWDADGSDFYGGRSIAEGSGHLVGIGVLVDEGNGDNVFSGVRLSQRVGFFEGVGLLDVEGHGNDQYRLENNATFFNEFEAFAGCDVSTRDGQGRGNFNGAGILLDAGGDDAYFVQSHDLRIPGAVRDDPTTTQGSAGSRLNLIGPPVDQVASTSLGVLVDQGGHDTYTRPGRADGHEQTTPQVSLFSDSGGSATETLVDANCALVSGVCSAWHGGRDSQTTDVCNDAGPVGLGGVLWPATFLGKPTAGELLREQGVTRESLGLCDDGPLTPAWTATELP